ncbi:MAG: SUF system NifU family Fe-S cluster assembly protein [Anaerolineales bacterium]|nr:SUF system NifU family Fe-S cluster assembly protein [Anaerolineales bacterium]MCB9127444.1 SUF system NifU family Fe-S cluster assembly protein [Ardenticatenales bacterium]MCB9172223.1 SUF system NifU family Fe-S cluster assembly protein [Ardenticatenales bacterium]
MDPLARETIIDYYRNPRNKGHLDAPTVSHEEKNPTCGDVVTIELMIEDGVIQDVRFDGHGCSISQAAASMLTERVMGQSLADVQALDKEAVMEMLGIELGPARLKCALLGLKALKVGAYGLESWDWQRGS